MPSDKEFGKLFPFEDVFRGEIESINKRRPRGRKIVLEKETNDDGEELVASDGTTPLRPTEASQVVGLALSGGGIRSAAFCLGALQGLRQAEVLDKIDYLSTVSGGGYIGCALTSGMTATGGRFPFKSMLSEDETPSMQHVRDYSNYLFPRGLRDFLRNGSIYLRGLVTNAVLILPFLLVAAALTIFSVPVAGEIGRPNVVGIAVPNIFSFKHFVLTAYVGLALLAATIVWAIYRSWHPANDEVSGPSTKFVGMIGLVFLITVFCELQPFVLDAMFMQGQRGYLPALIGVVRDVVLLLSPVAAAVAFLAQKFGDIAKNAIESERGQYKALLAKAAVYAVSAFVPLLVWLAYLQFSYWGICLTKSCVTYNAPDWLVAVAEVFPGCVTRGIWGVGTHIVAQLYIAVALLCLLLSTLLRPNANSLHPLYRNRLSKAFLFEPQKFMPSDGKGLKPQPRTLCELSEEYSPYHLINTAMNVQGSDQANRRGRNADFFLFSRNFIGSETTGYVETEDMQKVMSGLDLGAAMAASGAAASANMGSATIKPLIPTLALLNIRLGYWLRNPRRVKDGRAWNRLTNFYFVTEMLGMLNERRRSIYITDGGHIENLGIYELLRRRCKVIVAVDAEADPHLAFSSFNVLVRHALIDLGVRIELPWEAITKMTKKTAEGIDDHGYADKHAGPHVAVGEIGYPGGRRGILVYIKSSLTGDENDYVFHYKKRYTGFPHEATLDQLFSEEQFEVYRALGFHATHRFFDRRDDFAHPKADAFPRVRDDLKLLDKIFPLQSDPASAWPREHKTWSDWLPPPKRSRGGRPARKRRRRR